MRLIAWIGLASVLLTAGQPSLAQQEIFSASPWAREMALGLVVDQEQTQEGLLSGTLVGQIFTPATEFLERLDLIVKNRTDLTPGRIRILPWEGGLRQTAEAQPLWESSLDFSGQDAPVLRHYFPRIPLEPGRQYLIECSRPTEAFYLAGVQEDVYPGGHAIAAGFERPGWDMWFRTFTRGERMPLTVLPPRTLPDPPDLQPEPAREAPPISRETYLEIARAYLNQNIASWNREPGPRLNHLLFYTGFLYREVGQDLPAAEVSGWLRQGIEYIRQEGAGVSPWYVSLLGFGILWHRERPGWSDEDDAAAREIMLTATRRMWRAPERGAMNRAMWDVLVFRLAARLYPDVEEAAAWNQFADEVWHDWADYDDTNEDSSHYNAVFLHFMLAYAYLMDWQDLFERPGMRYFVDRYRDVLTPTGMMVSWGDSLGIGGDWGAWAAMFETAAKVTRDPTYKWAAHQVMQARPRYVLDDQPFLRAYEDMPSMVWACLGADDSVEAQPPASASAVFTAAYPRRHPLAFRREHGLDWFELEPRQTPWKMVLRSSLEETAYWSLFGLLPYAGHGHADAPAVLGLYANGTLLLHDSTYFDRAWHDHNLLFGVHVSGGDLGEEPSETAVVRFTPGQAADFADVAWSDYHGWGMPFRRQILFVKELGWLLHDRTDATAEAEWFLGPIWNVERMRARGDHWFDVDNPVPYSFAWPIANGTDHLLIYFTPRPGAIVDFVEMPYRVREGRPWYTSPPWTVYQVQGPVQVGPERQAHFSSLLLPVPGAEPAATAAENVRTLADETGASILEITRGAAKWTLAVLNDGGPHRVGPVTAQAAAVVVREVAGQAPAVEAFYATHLTAAGRTLLETDEPRHFSEGW